MDKNRKQRKSSAKRGQKARRSEGEQPARKSSGPNRPVNTHGPIAPNRPALPEGRVWIYGRHASAAAIANPLRRIHRILATQGAIAWLHEQRIGRENLSNLFEIRPHEIDALLHEGAVHQGLCVETEPLPAIALEDLAPPASGRPVIVLDQISDPQNIGAIFRSAAAFGAAAIIVQDRRTPPLAGPLAKAAAGAIETIACIEVVNIARSLRELQALGFYCAGLAGGAASSIAEAPKVRPLAIVLGAEGAGLRDLVSRNCDGLYRIPISENMESLNVSNAAAITLYETTRRQTGEE